MTDNYNKARADADFRKRAVYHYAKLQEELAKCKTPCQTMAAFACYHMEMEKLCRE